MSAVRRIVAVARLRYREGVRGPFLVFLVGYVGLALAACLLVPGEPGPERQQAVDRLVLDAMLLVAAVAAASLAAAPDPGDRAAGRDAVLDAGPLRPIEGLAGAWLGHGGCLLLLLLAMHVMSVQITTVFSGGSGDRPPTRVPVFADRFEGPAGAVADAPVALMKPGEAATWFLPGEGLAVKEPEVMIRLRLYTTPGNFEYPESVPVRVTVGTCEPREILVARNEPLRFRLTPDECRTTGEIPVRIERRGAAYALGVERDGLVAEGMPRLRFLNLAKALLAWFGVLMVLAAGAGMLGTFVQAPVAVAGILALALVGRSLDLLREAAGFLSPETLGGRTTSGLIRGVTALWPDLDAADLTGPVLAGWDIEASLLIGRLPATLIGVGVFLAAAWAIVTIRRRR